MSGRIEEIARHGPELLSYGDSPAQLQATLYNVIERALSEFVRECHADHEARPGTSFSTSVERVAKRWRIEP